MECLHETVTFAASLGYFCSFCGLVCQPTMIVDTCINPQTMRNKRKTKPHKKVSNRIFVWCGERFTLWERHAWLKVRHEVEKDVEGLKLPANTKQPLRQAFILLSFYFRCIQDELMLNHGFNELVARMSKENGVSKFDTVVERADNNLTFVSNTFVRPSFEAWVRFEIDLAFHIWHLESCDVEWIERLVTVAPHFGSALDTIHIKASVLFWLRLNFSNDHHLVHVIVTPAIEFAFDQICRFLGSDRDKILSFLGDSHLQLRHATMLLQTDKLLFPQDHITTTQTFMIRPETLFDMSQFQPLTWEKRIAKQGAKTFNNCMSFNVTTLESRRLSVKVFFNGVLQITGCKRNEDMFEVARQYQSFLPGQPTLYAYSTMLNYFLQLRKSRQDLLNLDAFLTRVRECWPNGFLLDQSVHKKKPGGTCIKLKNTIANMADSTVFVFRRDSEPERESLKKFLTDTGAVSRLSKLKEVSVYISPDHSASSIFFSCANAETFHQYKLWLVSLLGQFLLQ